MSLQRPFHSPGTWCIRCSPFMNFESSSCLKLSWTQLVETISDVVHVRRREKIWQHLLGGYQMKWPVTFLARLVRITSWWRQVWWSSRPSAWMCCLHLQHGQGVLTVLPLYWCCHLSRINTVSLFKIKEKYCIYNIMSSLENYQLHLIFAFLFRAS